MSTPYEKIYDNILYKFRSFEIPLMTVDEVREYLHDFLISATTKFHVCRKDLSDRDDILEYFNVDLSDIEIEILSNYAILEYIDSTYIREPTLLKITLSSKDFNAFSNANMLDKLIEMRETYLSENETLISRYAWMDVKAGNLLGSNYKKSVNRYDY